MMIGRWIDMSNMVNVNMYCFFFKQKTAYEMRISDWSSDVCSSDLGGADGGFEGRVVKGTVTAIENDLAVIDIGLKSEGRVPLREFAMPGQKSDLKVGDRKSVV